MVPALTARPKAALLAPQSGPAHTHALTRRGKRVPRALRPAQAAVPECSWLLAQSVQWAVRAAPGSPGRRVELSDVS